ncbi:MAG: VCBS repeat-containing protein, partial [Planctomycetes bacterium]|nr:VCBS repeat-containing protein [Planctomycetota bacterium]
MPIFALLEPRLLLNASLFGPQQVITTDADSASSVYAADLDGDGDMDVLSASYNDDKIAWYENIDSAGAFGPQQIITVNANGAESVYAADIDADGDLDVLSASYVDGKIAWYENVDGAGSYSPERVITTTANHTAGVIAADLDGDGDMDVLWSSYTKVGWYENKDGKGDFGLQRVITSKAVGIQCVTAADLDGDGDMDVLSASCYDDKIAWYENMDGAGDFSAQQVVTTSADWAASVYAGDLDGDGDIDVLSASYYDDKIAWYENLDGSGSFSAEKIIATDADGAKSAYAADLDGDGDLDVISAFGHHDEGIAWYENTDGGGNFGPKQVITTEVNRPMSVYAGDLDGDGDIDVLSGSYYDDKIAWYENRLIQLEGPKICILGQGLSIVDGDTEPRGADHTHFGNSGLVGESVIRPFTIVNTGTGVLDLTGTPPVQISGINASDFTIVAQPAEHVAAGAETTFEIEFIPTDSGPRTGTVIIASNDSDEATYDFVIEGFGNDAPWPDPSMWQYCPYATGATSIAMEAAPGEDPSGVEYYFECLTAGGHDSGWQTSPLYEDTSLLGNTTYAYRVKTRDKSTAHNEGTYSATASARTDLFCPQQIITIDAAVAWSVFAADLDGDGDMDALSSSGSDGWSGSTVVWYENTDGAGDFSITHMIDSEAYTPWCVYAADIDSDGDID